MRLSFRGTIDSSLDRDDYIKVADGRVASAGIPSAADRILRLTAALAFCSAPAGFLDA